MKAIARERYSERQWASLPVFQYRGREIAIEGVIRHFKRKRYQSLEEVVVRDNSLEANTPSDVRCLTPGIDLTTEYSQHPHGKRKYYRSW